VIWPAEAIWEAVSPNLSGFTVEILPELDSTNTELMRRARAGQTEPSLLVAERQTAGRGRLGRVWLDGDGAEAVGSSLKFSLGLPLQRQDWSGLSLAVGIAVVESLLHAANLPLSAVNLGLKWPNDLWQGEHKLGGILIETFGQTLPRYVVIGIGINITPPVPTAAVSFSTPPAGLQTLWPQADAGQALLWIAPALIAAVQQFDRDGFAPFQARFNALDVLRDAAVHLSDGSSGTARGVDASGALRVQTANGIQAISSGEVSVRPLHMALPH
jgi:BirA family biotin operon repressor/biotin-[acetyl-CoA-carboxylase] ligase